MMGRCEEDNETGGCPGTEARIAIESRPGFGFLLHRHRRRRRRRKLREHDDGLMNKSIFAKIQRKEDSPMFLLPLLLLSHLRRRS